MNRNKELRIFEALENLTKHESFDSTASFVRKFVDCDLDLNNTHQSIAEEDSTGNLEISLYVSSEEEEEDEVEEKGYSGGMFASGGQEKAEVKGGGREEERRRDGEEDVDSVGSLSEEEGEGEEEEDGDDDFNEILEEIRGKHSTEFLLLSEIKRSLELQESHLERERDVFTRQQSMEQKKLQAEKKSVENQKKNLQSLITDYHKIKCSKDESEERIKELTQKLRETKLEMNKRISRWADQQKKLEERVKALERENADLKKHKPVPPRIAALKRPPNVLVKPMSTQQKRISFADNVAGGEKPKRVEVPKFNGSYGRQPGAYGKVHVVRKPLCDAMNTINKEGVKKSDQVELADENKCSEIPVASNLEEGQLDSCKKDVCLSDDNADKTMPSDYIEVQHPCGTITRVTKDNKFTRHIMINNDIMDEFEDCSVRYYYRELGFSQTTYPNGDEVLEYDSGVLETIRSDGSRIYTFPDGLVKLVDSLGAEEVFFVDGSVMKKEANGECTITWPSGQKEIRTQTYVKRVYTNGTQKIMYADGSEETRYWNGRVRRKDKNGILVDDTKRKMNKNKNNATV